MNIDERSVIKKAAKVKIEHQLKMIEPIKDH